MRKGYLNLLFLICLISPNFIQGIVPLSYEFEDSPTDSAYYKYQNDSYTITENTGIGEFEISSVGYNLERFTGLLKMSIYTLGTPVVNSSFYYSMALEFENSTSKISIRTSFGAINDFNSSINSAFSIFYQNSTGSFDEQQELSLQSTSYNIYWEFQPTIVDIVRIYDDPNMLLSAIRAELEYNINGSSSLGTGDYYRDDFSQTEFDFSGAVQRDNSDDGLWDILNPVAIAIYITIPLITVKRFIQNRYLES